MAVMKRSCLALFFFLALVFALSPQETLANMLGAEAPDFSLKDSQGNIISLANYQGSIVMLVHFNTYCHTCREDVPFINRIYREYKNLKIIGIAIGNNAQEVSEFQKKYHPEYPIVPDPSKQVYTKYFVHTVPLIDIIDRTRTIRYRGKFPEYKQIASIMNTMVKEKEVIGADLWNKPPDFTLTASRGETFRLRDILGKKTILLTFLSIHDTTIRQVIEVMKSLYSRYRRKDLEIVRIAVGNSPEEVEHFIKRYYVNFPILLDQKARVAKLYGITTTPRTFIINKKGKIRYVSDRISLSNVEAILTKVKSYFKEELPEGILTQYLKKAAPGVEKFEKITLPENQVVYTGLNSDKKRVFVREVFKDVLCDVCTNVHFVYSFDLSGKIGNIVLIESIDLFGQPIEAEDFIQRVIHRANKKLPLPFSPNVDVITGATQSSKLIIEGLNETLEIVKSLKAYRNILAQIIN